MTGLAAERDAVLAANESFYRAFATGDFEAMELLWAAASPVSCVHPGWPPVHGREKVMQSWRGILSNPPRPPIHPLEAEVSVLGDSALVICFEALGDIYLVASNMFTREGDGWMLVHHQSGQTDIKPKSISEQLSTTVH